jgi:predicted Rossmann fold flavoprotein
MQKNSHFRTIVIGAGPAGLFAAANIQSSQTLVIEKKESPGRKLMISGTGQCNFTQAGAMSDFKNHYGDNFQFLRKALKSFTNQDAIEFFKARGVNCIIDQNGKVFPASLKAADILNALLISCRNAGAILHTGRSVISIKKENDLFVVNTDSGSYTSEYLALATGGKSYPTTGSTGDGYVFAASLGHTIAEPHPALAPVMVSNYELAELAGISFQNIEITHWRNKKKLRTFRGDIVLTHTGLSGPGILNNARYFMPGDELSINFCDISESEFEQEFVRQANNTGKLLISGFIKNTGIPKNLANFILLKIFGSLTKPLAEVSKIQRKSLINFSCAYPFIISQVGNFKTAMATAGGVVLHEINPSTMESLLVPKLYFCGEVMDIDGDTGGYNIQAAMSTAYLAAMDISMASET